MISDEYPDDGVTEAVAYGEPVDSFEEEDEEEGSDNAAGYGSLLSLGSGLRKKQPLIVVDPVEAENEARRVQFVAAQRFVASDETEAMDFLKGLAHLAEVGAAEAEGLAEEQAPCPETADDEAVVTCMTEAEAEGGTPVLSLVESIVEPEPAFHAFEEPECAEGEAPAFMPEGDQDQFAPAVEAVATTWQPAPPPSELAPQGHSLRARIPTHQPRRTWADHLAAFIGWLHDRLMPGRT